MKLVIIEDDFYIENEGHLLFVEREFIDSLLQLKNKHEIKQYLYTHLLPSLKIEKEKKILTSWLNNPNTDYTISQ